MAATAMAQTDALRAKKLAKYSNEITPRQIEALLRNDAKIRTAVAALCNTKSKRICIENVDRITYGPCELLVAFTLCDPPGLGSTARVYPCTAYTLGAMWIY